MSWSAMVDPVFRGFLPGRRFIWRRTVRLKKRSNFDEFATNSISNKKDDEHRRGRWH